MTRIVTSVVAASAFLALTCGAASAQQQFNGTWNVEVIPQSGTCNQTYRIRLIVQNGRISYGGTDGIGVSGAITSRGVVRANVGAGAMQATVAGRLTGRSGSGNWATSGSFNCAGQWRASKLA